MGLFDDNIYIEEYYKNIDIEEAMFLFESELNLIEDGYSDEYINEGVFGKIWEFIQGLINKIKELFNKLFGNEKTSSNKDNGQMAKDISVTVKNTTYHIDPKSGKVNPGKTASNDVTLDKLDNAVKNNITVTYKTAKYDHLDLDIIELYDHLCEHFDVNNPNSDKINSMDISTVNTLVISEILKYLNIKENDNFDNVITQYFRPDSNKKECKDDIVTISSKMFDLIGKGKKLSDDIKTIENRNKQLQSKIKNPSDKFCALYKAIFIYISKIQIIQSKMISEYNFSLSRLPGKSFDDFMN